MTGEMCCSPVKESNVDVEKKKRERKIWGPVWLAHALRSVNSCASLFISALILYLVVHFAGWLLLLQLHCRPNSPPPTTLDHTVDFIFVSLKNKRQFLIFSFLTCNRIFAFYKKPVKYNNNAGVFVQSFFLHAVCALTERKKGLKHHRFPFLPLVLTILFFLVFVFCNFVSLSPPPSAKVATCSWEYRSARTKLARPLWPSASALLCP